MGMPSGGGVQATASRPHEPGMYISCSYFLTAALQNAGLVLESRARFAQAPAAWIERALLPPGGQIHRYGNLSAEDLERRLVELGEGLYVVGLNIHVGFIVVRGGHAWFVHSSYTPPGTVVNEPIVSSMAIALSQSKGYWVSPLFKDDRIVEMWLRHQPVPAPPQWDGHWRLLNESLRQTWKPDHFRPRGSGGTISRRPSATSTSWSRRSTAAVIGPPTSVPSTPPTSSRPRSG
jgi:hypothetical protein